jgi:alkylated DNA repair protein (DNA oxidative demethylase)
MATGRLDEGELPFGRPAFLPLGDGAVLLGGFAERDSAALVDEIGRIAAAAPFRTMTTPGGRQMSVAMTNCGKAGWVSDRAGYRYSATDPDSGNPWPAMPELFAKLAVRAAAAAGYGAFAPDACLVNRYEPGVQLTLHQDRNERDFSAPIVSVSLGLPAVFVFGGKSRSDPARPVAVLHGDVVVWGGPSRLVYHGVRRLAEGTHPATGRVRFNLTLRRAL